MLAYRQNYPGQAIKTTMQWMRNAFASLISIVALSPSHCLADGPATAPATEFWFVSGTPTRPGWSGLCGAAFVQGYDRLAVTTDYCVHGLDTFKVTAPDGTEVSVHVASISRYFGLAVLKADVGFPAFPLASTEANPGDVLFAAYPPSAVMHNYKIQVVREAATSNTSFFAMTSDSPGLPAGAPLFDKTGTIVGIGTNMLMSPTQSNPVLLFGIGTFMLRSVMNDVANTGHIRPPVILGLKMQDLTPQLAAVLHLSRVQGAVLSSVSPEAQAAGLRIVDVITVLNGTPVTGAASLVGLLRQHYAGDTLKFALIRGGKSIEVEMIAPTPSESESLERATGQATALKELP